MQAYWNRIKNNGFATQSVKKTVAKTVEHSSTKQKSTKATKKVYIDVDSRLFTIQYTLPFVKTYAIQHDAKHVGMETMFVDFVKYVKNKNTTVNVEKMKTKQFKHKLRMSYVRECGRLFMYNMYNVVPKNNPVRVKYCTTQMNASQCLNEVINLNAEDYAKHYDYKFQRRQIEAFRKKCIQEGTLFQWKIVKTSFRHETYYVEKKC